MRGREVREMTRSQKLWFRAAVAHQMWLLYAKLYNCGSSFDYSCRVACGAQARYFDALSRAAEKLCPQAETCVYTKNLLEEWRTISAIAVQIGCERAGLC